MDPATLTPLDQALAQLSALTAAGAAPERIMQEVGTLVAGWAGEPEMDADAARTRIELMWDGLGKDAADLQATISDAGPVDAGTLGGAKRMLTALQAAIAALTAAHARL